MRMRLTVSMLLFVGAVLLLRPVVEAQQSGTAGDSNHELNLAVTFTTQRSNLTTGNIFWGQGGSAELSVPLHRRLGFAVNITGIRGSDVTMLTTTIGPQYTWTHPFHHQKRLDLFGQTLIGESMGFDSTFPFPFGLDSSSHAFALQLGGGVDLGVSQHFAVRLLQADWLRTQFRNGTTNVQNNMLLSAGVVFRFP